MARLQGRVAGPDVGEMTDLLGRLVDVDSPSHDADACAAAMAVVAAELHDAGGAVDWLAPAGRSPVVRATWGRQSRPVLILGHVDTVWPAGEASRRPFTVVDGFGRGPGVLDMKAGLVQMVHAIRLLAADAMPDMTVLLNADEELGSPGSEMLIEGEAVRSRCALVLEPSGPGGAVKSSRKGIALYQVEVEGRAAHPGADPEAGVSAVLELAEQALALDRLADLAAGTTVNVGRMAGGTRCNVVAGAACAEFETRFWTQAEGRRVDRAVHALQPLRDGARVRVSGGLHRQPLERTPAVARLVELARQAARDDGWELTEAAVGGVSDGNLTAALGLPTLDGLGAVGVGAHSLDEAVRVDAMAVRAGWLARTIRRAAADHAFASPSPSARTGRFRPTDKERDTMNAHSRETSAEPATARRLALSFGQEQMWFLDQFAPGEPTYNVAVVHRLHGPLDADVLQRALTTLVGRHEMLRTTFGTVDGAPFQQIGSGSDVTLVRIDLRDRRDADLEQALEAAVTRETSAPFDLETGPLARFRLFVLGEQHHVLCATVHHITTDGWSMGVLYRELSEIYGALLDDQAAVSRPQPRYADYVTWQRMQLGDALEGQLQFWDRTLVQLPELDLPADRGRPASPSFRGDDVCFDVPAELLAQLRELGRRQGASLFMLLAAAVNVVFSRYTGQEDIPLGVSMLGRSQPELEDVFGLFTNMVVLRSDLSGDPTFASLVERTAEACLDAYENQDAPFEKVVQRVQPVRDPSRNPLFQVSLQLLGDDNSGNALELRGVAVEVLKSATTRSRFDMALNFVESGDRLRLEIEYATDLFDRWRVQALAEHVANVLAAAVEDPAVRLSQMPIISDRERQDLLAAGRGEPLAYGEQTMHALVAARAAADPSAVAAVCRDRELTYGELNERADKLARYLRSRGVQGQQIVAVALERSLDALVAVLGVMKSGAAYALLDVNSPQSRLAFMLKDTEAPVLLTQSTLLERMPQPDGWEALAIDTEWARVELVPAEEPFAERASRDSLAYVLYTSGSSGKPKGVLIEHRALISFVESYRRTFDLVREDRMLQLAALSFDMSQGEIFAGLSAGATLVLVSPEAGSSPEALAELMRTERVSYICMSPAMLSLLEAEPYPHLRKIMAGGEALPGELVNKWNLDGRRLINCYGPTEATVGCTAYECEHRVWQSSPPIGVPFNDRRVYVVDRAGNLVPRGVPGELLIGGEEGLARGYLNQPELTAQQFVADPFHLEGRVYRTGDLVRWTPDWQLEFLGRLDNQVKLNGIRIELEEIESTLLAHPLIATAVVTVQADARGEHRLVGYVVPAKGEKPAVSDIRGHLAAHLPAYMVPSAWMVLDDLPLTTARKVDRTALPPVEQAAVDDDAPVLDASTTTQRAVAEIFADVLSLPRVGADGHFFELGGSSLQAMRALSRLNQTFGIKLTIRRLYRAATVDAVSSMIDDLVGETSGPEASVEHLDLLSRIEQMSEEEATKLLTTAHQTGRVSHDG